MLKNLFILTLSMLLIVIGSTRIDAHTGFCGGAMITLPFVDVPATNIFFCSIAAAYFSGLTNGTSATTYSPEANVTREQIAAFIARTHDSALRRGARRAALNQWWIPQNENALRLSPLDGTPQFVVCDGTDLWVAHFTGSVWRLRANDGRFIEDWQGTPRAVGIIAAAGRIYVTGPDTPVSKVFRIDPTQPPGAAQTLTDSAGPNAQGITFDGRNIWTANIGITIGSGSISRINISTAAVDTFTTGFSSPIGILFDGSNLWVTDYGDDTLKRVGLDGSVVQTVPLGSNPQYPVFDGTNIWVPLNQSNSLAVVRTATGAILATLTGNGLDGPLQAAFDGERIMVTNFNGRSVSLWKAADLTPLGFVSTGANTRPTGVCSDGLNFWITLDGPNRLAQF